MFEKLKKATHSYVATLPCGCGVAMVIDCVDFPKDTAKDVAGFIRQGLIVNRIEQSKAVEAFSAKCAQYPHEDWQHRIEAARLQRRSELPLSAPAVAGTD